MKILSNKFTPPLNENWVCELDENNFERILENLKVLNYRWTFKGDIDSKEHSKRILSYFPKIWLVNNDNNRGDKLISYFYEETLLENEIQKNKRKIIKI